MTQSTKRSRPYPARRTRAWSQRVTKTAAWANWRQQVFRRDSYACVMCPKTSAAKLTFKAQRRHLEPHHIIRKIDHPELMYEVDNGVTLCNCCHEKVTDHEKEYEARFTIYVRRLRAREEVLLNLDMSGLEI
jgi:5-methylcytosine-specific restriction endonuclease McrA